MKLVQCSAGPLTNKEGLIENMKVQGSLGCSDYEMVEFRILRGASRVKIKITMLDFRRADSGALTSQICLIESYGIRPWREEAPRKAG